MKITPFARASSCAALRHIALLLACLTAALAAPDARAATYHVDVTTGDDARTAAEAQAPATPWQSITRAIAEPALAAGDRIEVAAGTYDSGPETFPLTLVDGVELVGAGRDVTVISGPADTDLFQNLDTPLSTATLLSGFTLTWDGSFATSASALYFEVASAAVSPTVDGNRFLSPVGSASGTAMRTLDTGADARSFTPLVRDNELQGLARGFQGLWDDGGTAAVVSPVFEGNVLTEVEIGFQLLLEELFEGTVAPEITGGNAFADGGGVLVGAVGLSGAGATLRPVVSGNRFTDTDSEAIALVVGNIELASSSDRLVFSPIVVGNEITRAGGDGVVIGVGNVVASVLEIHPLVAGNIIEAAGEDGMSLALGNFEAGELEAAFTLANNRVTDASSDGIVVVLGNLSELDESVVGLAVAGNAVSDPGSSGVSIVVANLQDSELDVDLMIEGNHLGGAATDGLDVVLVLQSVSGLARMRIDDNIIEGSAAKGIVLVHGGNEPAAQAGASYVSGTCNRVTGNDGGGVEAHGFDVASDWGGGGLSPGLNTFLGNGRDFHSTSFVDTTPAESNWWGTTHSSTIAGNVFGSVDFDPFLTGPPGVAIETTLSVLLASDDTLPTGPSAGDTFAYTAVGQGTGECGCATAVLTIPIPANATLDPDSIAVGGEGTLLHADAVEIVVGLGSLTASDLVTVDFELLADEGAELSLQGELACRADASSLLAEPTDDPDTPADDDPTTIALLAEGASLAAEKTVAADGGASPGTIVVYEIVVTNLGPADLDDHPGDELVDILPAELELLSATSDVGTTVPNPVANSVTWNGGLAAGTSATITIEALIAATVTAGTSVTNQASLAFDTDGDGDNDGAGLSDDPGQPGAEDPTVFIVAAVDTPPSVVEIPTLGGWGLAVLALLLAGGGLVVRGRWS